MKTPKIILSLLLITSIFAACKKDQPIEPEKTSPSAKNIEIGSANSKQGLIGRDFHLNADVLAGDKIKEVWVKILQKSGESYSAKWKLELTWPEYKGVKNTNVHKHFTIPSDAPEGKYDFYFLVTDENGTKLEIREDFIIKDPAKIPVDPKIGRDILSRNGTMIYYMDTWVEKDLIFKKGDELVAHAQVSDIKGDGILYSLLINKKHNYFPETIDNLDLSKVIVISKTEHKDLPSGSKISTLKQIDGVWGGENLSIGKDKSMESGKYNWVILYKNTSYNMNVYKSIPVAIDLN